MSSFDLLGEDGFDDLAVDVGEAVASALEFVGELFVVEAHLVEDGGMEIVDVDGVCFPSGKVGQLKELS